ncbi:MAG: tryptophan synthase subunit alpha, partial [Desulfarculus sp.]|nr:tryptophan synthase subunit alpha [Desulfarculus sp.]
MSVDLNQAFAAARQKNRAAFIPFVSGGFPDPAACAELIRGLDDLGAEVIEVGLPFSDPMADGPVIQASSQRALERGATPGRVLEMVAEVAPRLGAALVLMTYYNPVLQMGLADFARRAAEAGAAGVIVPDLPPEEAGPWRRAAGKAGLDT